MMKLHTKWPRVPSVDRPIIVVIAESGAVVIVPGYNISLLNDIL